MDTTAQTPTRARYGVLAFTLALTAIAYLDRVRISITAPFIKQDLGLSNPEMGYVFGAFTFAYALFEIPSGWMADRFGARVTLMRIVICWSIMSALTGWAWGFWSLFFIRLLFGMGEAGTLPGISRVYVRWLPKQRHGWAFGLALMMAAVGSGISQPMIAWMLEDLKWNWRFIFQIFSVLGITWAVAWYFWFRNDPHHHPAVNKAELDEIGCAPPTSHSKVPWGMILRNRTLILLCLLCGCWLYGWYFWLTWLPSYLNTAHGFDIKKAGMLSSLPLICSAIGMFLGGWSSDFFSKKWGTKKGRRTPGSICLPVASVAIVMATFSSSGINAAILLSIAAGLAAMGITPMFAVCLEIGGKYAGVASGTMNMVGNLFGTLSPIVVGQLVVDKDLASWNLPLYIVAGAYLVAAIGWFFVDPGIRIEEGSEKSEVEIEADKALA